QQAMKSGQFSGRSLTQHYLDRIEAIDKQGPALRSVIEINPDALAMGEALDRERASKGARGPLHGIPVLVKDNISSGDRMVTSAGSLALAHWIAPQDALVVKKLRNA